MKQTPILTKTFNSDVAVVANRVVVVGTASTGLGLGGSVKYPAAARAVKIVGVTWQASDNEKTVDVVVAGIVQIASDGSAAIAIGDTVEVADTGGQIRTVVLTAPATPGTQGNWILRQLVGTALSGAANAAAGALVDVQLTLTYVLAL